MRKTSNRIFRAMVVGLWIGSVCVANDPFATEIRPFLRTHCVDCHSADDAKGGLDLTGYGSADDLIADFRRWERVIEFVRHGEMPPEEMPQPTVAERDRVTTAIESILLAEARRNAGDPGAVPARRLSLVEFDTSVSDLIGVPVRPTADFPPDPAGGEGFDNTGEALGMTPSLFGKFFDASRDVSRHLIVTPDGIQFADTPADNYNARRKLTEEAVIDFYRAHDIDLPRYLEAAWRYHHRDDRNQSPEEFATDHNLSARYFDRLIGFLSNSDPAAVGLLREIDQLWNKLPAPNSDDDRPDELRQFVRTVQFARKKLHGPEERLIRSNAGNWPIQHLAFRDEQAARRNRFDPETLQTEHRVRFDKPRDAEPRKNETADQFRERNTYRIRMEPLGTDVDSAFVIVHRPILSRSGDRPKREDDRKKHEVRTLREVLERHAPQLARKLKFGRHPLGGAIDPDSFVLRAPAVIELPLEPGGKALPEFVGKHLIIDLRLDPDHSAESAAWVSHALGGSFGTDSFADDRSELLLHPGSDLADRFAKSAKRFCRVMPNRFFSVDDKRGLAAGFHLVEGFYRDDRPLVELVLNDGEQAELDRLWRDLLFATKATETLLRGFVWFERSERGVLQDQRFDFLRAEDPELVGPELLERFERLYLEKLGVKLIENSLAPIEPNDRFEMVHGFFEDIRAGLRTQDELLSVAEAEALSDLERLAERAYRRSLTDADRTELRTLYQTLRAEELTVEESIRSVFAAMLVSPDFLFHRYGSENSRRTAKGETTVPLTDRELATRLSYFLWSSLPDEELTTLSERQRLTDPQVLREQTRRMIADPRVETFAREFFGQWLRYRDFPAKDPIADGEFPKYTEELRQAMAEEPVRLLSHLIREDRPVTDLLGSDLTFVNRVLADHYGGPIAKTYREGFDRWRREREARGEPIPRDQNEVWLPVTGLRNHGRGGLAGTAVILTTNSSGGRTSPVKRGFWVAHHLLGQHFPPPPADVAELPDTEREAEKSIRELLAAHAADSRCAMCHKHFDGMGLTLEGFDPLGRTRDRDSAGRPIDNAAEVRGEPIEGLSELIDHLETKRRDDFVRTLCRKFLGYALGRSVLLSDQPLLDRMRTDLEANNHRFSVLFETVVTSEQFLRRRTE